MSATGSKEKPSQVLDRWPGVSVDPDGVFKYVLIEAYAQDEEDATEHVKLLVRGYQWAEFHNEVYDDEEEKLRRAGLDCQCLGGGRIQHDPANKYIKVYGYSVGFGRADHSKSREVLLRHFPHYTIEISDDGY